MEVTLFGGPHDGRRVHIDSAVVDSRRFLIHDEPEHPSYALPEPGDKPTARRQPVSLYELRLWADGPTTGPQARDTILYRRWMYTGPYR